MAFEYLGFLLETNEEEDYNVFSIDRDYLRQMEDPFELNQNEFRQLYRISKDLCQFLVQSLDSSLRGSRVTAISTEKLVLAALRFYATGCYQRPVGEQWGISMSQPAMSRAIHKVTDAINDVLLQSNVRFPMTHIERQAAKTAFLACPAPFNGAIGAIDCTHVAILGPNIHEEAYVNHHGYHSINVQMICDPKLRILNVNARYPGARHDSYIWQSCSARSAMERAFVGGDRHAFLIGDAGYPLEPWLMTPLTNFPEGTPEFAYNKALCKARNVIERLFGVLKATWRCLSRQRMLMYSPGFSGRIVNACSVLHNLRLGHQDFNPDEYDDIEILESIEDIVPPEPVPSTTLNVARRVQRRIINNFNLH